MGKLTVTNMDGDDERTDKDSERSLPASPQSNSKNNPAVTDSSSGENGTNNRSDGRRRRSRRNQRNPSRSLNRKDRLNIQSSEKDTNVSIEDVSKEIDMPAHQRRKRRRRNHPRRPKYKPYIKLSWEERMERDEAESERATRRRANRPTPYNTTQFLMEDHKADTPDLSALAETNDNDTSEEIFEEDFRNGEYLEKNFSAVYDEVQSERLQSMSKEQLVNEVLALSKRVAELEESQRKLKIEHGIETASKGDEKESNSSIISSRKEDLQVQKVKSPPRDYTSGQKT